MRLRKFSRVELFLFATPAVALVLALAVHWHASPGVYLGEFNTFGGAEYAGHQAAMKKLSTLLTQHPHTNVFILRWQENVTEAKAYVRMVYTRSDNTIRIDDDADFSVVTRKLSRESEQYADIKVENVRDEAIHQAASHSEHFRNLPEYGCRVFIGSGSGRMEWK